MSTRVPYSEPPEPDDGWIYTSHARIECEACGEWIYTRYRGEGDAATFPPECQVCGASVPSLVIPEEHVAEGTQE